MRALFTENVKNVDYVENNKIAKNVKILKNVENVSDENKHNALRTMSKRQNVWRNS